MFIGRKKELQKLNELYNSYGFQLCFLYGKTGVGKTALLKELCKDKDAIFFKAEPKSSRANLELFSQTVSLHFIAKNKLPPTSFQFWDNAISYVGKECKNSRLVLVIDDFNEIAKKDTVFLSSLAHLIGQELKDTKIFLILSSNSINNIRTPFTSLIRLDTYLTDEVVEQLKAQIARTAGGNSQLRVQKFSADEIIIREGETCDDLFKIISGGAVCYLNYSHENEYILGTLKEESTCGEYSLLMNEPEIFSVVAFTDVLALRVSRTDFEKFIAASAKNAVGIMKNLARMLKVMKVNIGMLSSE